MRILTILCLASLAASPLAAQGQHSGEPGHRALLPRDREIALARSAAPPAVSDSAAIWVLGDRAYELAVPGTNGNACYVSRDWLASLEPQCFDAEGAATVLPIAIRRLDLLQQGHTMEEAARDVADGIASGRFRLPRRPAMSYMMSYDQQLVGRAGQPAQRWQPHLMIYYPYLTAADLGLGAGDPATAMVVDAGTPLANIMIVLRDFVQSAGAAASR
jgi:hypothetical protein